MLHGFFSVAYLGRIHGFANLIEDVKRSRTSENSCGSRDSHLADGSGPLRNGVLVELPKVVVGDQGGFGIFELDSLGVHLGTGLLLSHVRHIESCSGAEL